MFKKFLILGLILTLIGSAALMLILTKHKEERKQAASYKLKYASEADEYINQYNRWLELPPEERVQLALEQGEDNNCKTVTQIRKKQHERLKADLDKLAAGEIVAPPFADILYGSSWRDELDKYKKQKERSEFMFTASAVCTSIGGTISVWCLLLWMVRLALKGLSHVPRFLACILSRYRKVKDKQLYEAYAQKADISWQSPQKQQRKKIKRRSDVLEDSGCHGINADHQDQQQSGPQVAASVTRDSDSDEKTSSAKKIAMLLSSERSVESEEFSVTPVQAVDQGDATMNARRDQTEADQTETGANANSENREASLKNQAENLERQIAEFKHMAQSVQQTTLEQSKPLSKTLKDLTEQVSAIREYAACQQQRVEKLQDGYDWNIVRTFCLRIIRCIDNLESRINQLAEEDSQTVHLKEVRDELLFALESSGIEKFEPILNSNYKGQERFAEAVKEKQHCDDPNQAGMIAEVIRSGYQYFIDDNNVKVVRAAQVKLFG